MLLALPLLRSVSKSIEERMVQGFFGRQSILWIHNEKTIHERESLFIKFTNVFLLEGLWLGDVREFVAYKTRIRVKLLLLQPSEWPHNFLNAVQLVDVGLSGEQGLPIR